MIASLQVVLQGKRSERSFNEYFTKTEEKCKELGIDEAFSLPKRRRVSTRIDETPTSHQQKTITELSFM